jgi:hypothetical protein
MPYSSPASSARTDVHAAAFITGPVAESCLRGHLAGGQEVTVRVTSLHPRDQLLNAPADLNRVFH